MRPFGIIRREQGLSLLSAAVRLEISPDYLRQLERGSDPLTWGLAERMAYVYDVPQEELISLRKLKPGFSPNAQLRPRGGSSANVVRRMKFAPLRFNQVWKPDVIRIERSPSTRPQFMARPGLPPGLRELIPDEGKPVQRAPRFMVPPELLRLELGHSEEEPAVSQHVRGPSPADLLDNMVDIIRGEIFTLTEGPPKRKKKKK